MRFEVGIQRDGKNLGGLELSRQLNLEKKKTAEKRDKEHILRGVGCYYIFALSDTGQTDKISEY